MGVVAQQLARADADIPVTQLFLTGGDTTVEDAVTKQNSRPGVSYGQMLRNARVHDSDGLLTDHENAASGRTA